MTLKRNFTVLKKRVVNQKTGTSQQAPIGSGKSSFLGRAMANRSIRKQAPFGSGIGSGKSSFLGRAVAANRSIRKQAPFGSGKSGILGRAVAAKASLRKLHAGVGEMEN